MLLSITCIVLFITTCSASWNSEDLALYDLVEDLNENFYKFFSLEKECSLNDIKKAYRRLSLEWHPDRNSAPEATDRFRQVVGVYEVLKSKESREKYDNVLEFGLPDWRQPIYYYRKMRKFTWYEAVLVMLLIASVAHYGMMWAAYFEKYLVLTQNQKTSRSMKKKGEKMIEEEERFIKETLEGYKPQLLNLLPFLLFKWTWEGTKLLIVIIRESMKKKEIVVEEEQESEPVRRRPATVPQPVFEYEVATDLKAVSMNHPELEKKFRAETEEVEKKLSGAVWSCDELSQLIRLSTEKYPAGTPNRWELMAQVLNRTAEDVTTMAGKLKQMKQEEYTKLVKGQQSQAVNASAASRTTNTEAATVAEKADNSTEDWSQLEQKRFEMALQQYPKGTDDRWGQISSSVGSKTSEQCMQRFKQLAELVRRRKAAGS